jgi:hypothetical protein
VKHARDIWVWLTVRQVTQVSILVHNQEHERRKEALPDHIRQDMRDSCLLCTLVRLPVKTAPPDLLLYINS